MVVGQLEIQLLANMARLQSDMEKAQRTVGNVVGKINGILGAIGVGISVDFLLGLKAKADAYNKSLAALSTQLGDATNQIKELDAASRSLSIQFGTDAIKQSAGFYEILSAGITDTVQATAVLTEANRLAIGGNADLMVSVDGLTSIIKGYGNAAGTAAEIADTMFTASLAGKLSIQELSENIGKVIPLATTMEISLEQVTSAISALTLGGLSAKESITGVRAILATIAKPSAEAARLAKEIGLEFNTTGVQALGLAGFLDQVKERTQGSADKMAILFGGVESLVPALALTGNAGVEFNNILGQMANKAGATEEAFNKMAASPGFKWDQFMSTMSNIAITLGDALANVLTPAAEMAAKALNKLFGFNDVTGIEKQVQLVNQLTEKVESMANRKHVPIIGGILFDKKEFDLLGHQLEMAKADLTAMQKVQQTATVAQKQSTVEVIKNTVELEKNNAVVTKAARVAEVRNKAFDIELVKLKQYESEAKRARDITDSVATEQEIYNRKLDELNRLKPYLSIEIYERALQKLNGTTKETAVITRNTTDEMSQMRIQAGRNIQTSLGNMVFDFFNDGLKGMIRNAGNAVLRIMSEFAGLKIAQSIGLAGMFTAPGMASASGVGGTGNMMMNIASMGTNAMSFMRSGFGIPGALGSFGSMLPGSAGAFFSGMGGTGAAAAQGAQALWGASGLTGANAMGAAAGSAFAAAAGPLMIAAAATAGLKALAGDKRMGGGFGKAINAIGDVPILGEFFGLAPLLNALFGRGPLKQRETTLSGSLGMEGFESGSLQTDFRAKGGLFRSNKNDYARVDAVTGAVSTDNTKQLSEFAKELSKASRDIFGVFENAATQTAETINKTAQNLGLGTEALKNFIYEINLVSEKGKGLTEEQISAEIEKITDAMARSFLPQVDELSKRGESAIQTVSRLNTEFVTLTQAAQNLGASAAYAKEIVSGLSFDTRTRYVDAAGGPEELIRLTQRFGEIFLTEAERMAPAIEFVESGLESLGISATISKDALGDLIQTLIQSASDADKAKALLLLQNQETFNLVNNYKESLSGNGEIAKSTVEALSEAFSMLRKSVDAERKRATDQYNDSLEQVNSRIQNVTDSINKLKSLSSALANTFDVLRPISREEAKFQILSAINTAKLGGGLPDVADISKALNVLQSNNITGVRSSFELAREQAKTANLVADLGSLTDAQLSVEERSLIELQEQRRKLTDGFEQEMLRLDLMLEQGQKEIDTLNGLDSTILTLAKAIELFNLRSVQAGGGGGIGGGAISGNPDISDQTIRDFVNTPGRTEMEIYNAAKANGVSFEQYAAATGAKLEDLYSWADRNNLPKFATGASYIPKTGPAIVHQGERIIPAEQNRDLKKAMGNDEVIEEVKLLRDEMAKLYKLFDTLTQKGTALRTKSVA